MEREVTYKEYQEFLKRYVPIRYLNENMLEEEISPLLRIGKFEIWGVTMTPDLSDAYLTIFLNAYYDGALNENPIICRVSIKNPKYLDNPAQTGIKLSKEQKNYLIDFMKTNWGNVLWQLFCSADNNNIKLDMNEIFNNWQFPDYSSLETCD